jgi:hypothetical protein
MANLEKRIADLANKLGGHRPYCLTCQNERRFIVIAEDDDDGEPRVTGERCPSCGSPDAVVIRIVPDDVQPIRPATLPRAPRIRWEDSDGV